MPKGKAPRAGGQRVPLETAVPPALGKEICPEFRSIYFRMGRKDFMHIVLVNMSDLKVKTEEVPA